MTAKSSLIILSCLVCGCGPAIRAEQTDPAEQYVWKNAVIRGGGFVREWSKEQRTGAARLAELWEKALSSPMARAEADVLPLVRGQFEVLEAAAALGLSTGSRPETSGNPKLS